MHSAFTRGRKRAAHESRNQRSQEAANTKAFEDISGSLLIIAVCTHIVRLNKLEINRTKVIGFPMLQCITWAESHFDTWQHIPMLLDNCFSELSPPNHSLAADLFSIFPFRGTSGLRVLATATYTCTSHRRSTTARDGTQYITTRRDCSLVSPNAHNSLQNRIFCFILSHNFYEYVLRFIVVSSSQSYINSLVQPPAPMCLESRGNVFCVGGQSLLL